MPSFTLIFCANSVSSVLKDQRLAKTLRSPWFLTLIFSSVQICQFRADLKICA